MELKWNEHNDARCKTLSRSIAVLRRARAYIFPKRLLSECSMNYNHGIILWDNPGSAR